MKRTGRSLKFFPPAVLPALTLVIALGFFIRPAQANYIATLEQVGSGLIATGNGAIDLTGLSFPATFGTVAGIFPSIGFMSLGPTSFPSTDQYTGITGPTSFGIGGFNNASSGSGDLVGINGRDGILVVPQGYISGSPLSSSSTYPGLTFGSLGVTPGTYVWAWGTGPDQNFALQIGPATVPDSDSTLGLLLLASAILFAARQLRLA
jgi:hypothetical protein